MHHLLPIKLAPPDVTMPASPTKQVPSSKRTKRQQRPYDAAKRPRARVRKDSQSSSAKQQSTTCSTLLGDAVVSPAPVYPSLSSSTSTVPSTRMRTVRELCTLVARKKVPYFTPRNDWELLFLSTDNYKGPPSGFVDHINRQFAIDLKRQPHEELMETARKILDEVVEPTGLKPELLGDPQVFVRPIPDSEYSIRLFPGNAESRDYCLDFVRTATGEPVNSPFTFDLFCVPDPNAPASTGGPIVSMRPLECAFGISRDQISPGTEKFLLRDGAHCVLRRPGHRDVRFTVPIRRRPQLPMQHVDAHILELPTYVD